MPKATNRTAPARGGSDHRRTQPRRPVKKKNHKLEFLRDTKARPPKGGTKHKGTGATFSTTVSFGTTGSATVTVSINNYDNQRKQYSVYGAQQAPPNEDPNALLAYSENHPAGSQLGSDMSFDENEAFYVELYFYRGTTKGKAGVTIPATSVVEGTVVDLPLTQLPLP